MCACPLFQFQDLQEGMLVRVRCASSERSNCQRLQEMGLTEGTVFKVIKVAPFGDPIEIDLRGSRVCLRKCEVCGFDIEIIDPETI